MVFSTATLAVVVGQFSFNFSSTMMQTYLPTFLRDVMNLDLDQVGSFIFSYKNGRYFKLV